MWAWAGTSRGRGELRGPRGAGTPTAVRLACVDRASRGSGHRQKSFCGRRLAISGRTGAPVRAWSGLRAHDQEKRRLASQGHSVRADTRSGTPLGGPEPWSSTSGSCRPPHQPLIRPCSPWSGARPGTASRRHAADYQPRSEFLEFPKTRLLLVYSARVGGRSTHVAPSQPRVGRVGGRPAAVS